MATNKGKIIIDRTRPAIVKSIDGDIEFLATFGGNKTAVNYLEFVKEEAQKRINAIESKTNEEE